MKEGQAAGMRKLMMSGAKASAVGRLDFLCFLLHAEKQELTVAKACEQPGISCHLVQVKTELEGAS